MNTHPDFLVYSKKKRMVRFYEKRMETGKENLDK